MNIPNPMPCRCTKGTSDISGTEITLDSAGSCGDATDVFITYKSQSVVVFFGSDQIALGAFDGSIVETGQSVGNTKDVVVCANEGKYFCCTDDYNWDGVIDHFDSAIYKCWLEEGKPENLADLQKAYKNRVDSKTGWPDTIPCKLPSIPCADFDLSDATGEEDSDMHTGATHLFGNVKAKTPPTDGYTTELYYPSLQQHEEWSSEDMKALPSQFSRQLLNDLDDEVCPTAEDFSIVTKCTTNFSNVCLYNDEEITDTANCIFQNDLDFSFQITYDGPYIRLKDVKYSLIKKNRAETNSDPHGNPLQSLEDLKSISNPASASLPSKVTHIGGNEEYHSRFTGEIIIDDKCTWRLNLYTETPDCTVSGSHELIKTQIHECVNCTADICEDEYPDYVKCDVGAAALASGTLCSDLSAGDDVICIITNDILEPNAPLILNPGTNDQEHIILESLVDAVNDLDVSGALASGTLCSDLSAGDDVICIITNDILEPNAPLILNPGTNDQEHIILESLANDANDV